MQIFQRKTQTKSVAEPVYKNLTTKKQNLTMTVKKLDLDKPNFTWIDFISDGEDLAMCMRKPGN